MKMRFPGFILAALALTALPGSAQTSMDRVLISGLEDGFGLSQQFEQMGLDVVEGTVQATSMELVVSPWSHTFLINQGYAPVMLEEGRPLKEKLAELGNSPNNNAQFFLDNPTEAVPTGYPDLATIHAIMGNIEAANPALVKVINLTTDYGAPPTIEGRDIMALKISDNVDQDEDELTMLLISNQHCREIITPVIALTAAFNLSNDYGSDPTTTAVVDSHELFIIPTGNPDGYEYVFNTNQNWRKNRRNNGGGCFGVDINRNFGAGWSAPCSGSSNTCSDTYKGAAQFSEPESVAVQVLTTAEHFGKVMDYHSSGRETLWGYSCGIHPWDAFMTATAIVLSQASGYGNSNRRPSAEGEHYEWQFKRGAFSHLQETGTSFQPSFASAQTEAANVYGSVISMLDTPIHFTGHVTDACSGAPLNATVEFQGLNFPYAGEVTSGGTYGRYNTHPPSGNYTVDFVAAGYVTQSFPVTIVNGSTTTLDVALVSTAPVVTSYCTAGTTASGCQATLSASGTPSASAASGFVVTGTGAEGNKDGLFFFGSNGQQANPWGSGTSFQCVAPPTSRTALITGVGNNGACDGTYSADLNARWTAKPNQNPGAGATVQAQLWFRDPGNTSNQTTSLSDAIEFEVCE